MAIIPEKALNNALEKNVTVTLKNGRELRGTLRGFDESANLVLADAEEGEGEKLKKMPLLILKGSMVSSLKLGAEQRH